MNKKPSIYRKYNDDITDMDNQLNACLEVLIDKFDINEEDIVFYTDVNYNSRFDYRPELERMITDIQNGNIDICVTYSVNKLSRDIETIVKIKNILKENDCDIYLVKEGCFLNEDLGFIADIQKAYHEVLNNPDLEFNFDEEDEFYDDLEY